VWPPLTEIAISWNGLPQYAARLIRGAINELGTPCAVIGSRPSVPVEGMERVLGQSVHWVDAARPLSWRELKLEVPRVFVQSGWGYPAFSALGAQVKAAGGRVVGLSDANWRGDFRQMVLGSIAFRVSKRRRFDAMLVPGRQGERLMRWLGMPQEVVKIGMYGADPEVFQSSDDITSRPKRFLFVGQFIERKDVLGLCNAFLRFAPGHPEWTLQLCGSGPQHELIPRHPRIVIEPFVQPEALAERYRQARFFVLPSLEEAWGLVVHEAALSGCALLLSDRIGSADDLCNSRNGTRFRAGSEDDLLRGLESAASRDDTWLRDASSESRRLAAYFGPERFGRELAKLIRSLS
jgi:glycosyltransferase involved in cell wall biosynthesis